MKAVIVDNEKKIWLQDDAGIFVPPLILIVCDRQDAYQRYIHYNPNLGKTRFIYSMQNARGFDYRRCLIIKLRPYQNALRKPIDIDFIKIFHYVVNQSDYQDEVLLSADFDDTKIKKITEE